MAAVSFFSFCLTALLVLEILVRKSDFFSPVRVFLLAHSLALGVSFLAFDRAMTPFKPLTSVIYFGGGACFLIALAMVRLLTGPHPKTPAKMDWEGYNWKLHMVFSLGLLAFAVFGLLGCYAFAGGFPLLAENKIKVLREFQKTPTTFLFPFSFSGMVMAMFFMRLVRPASPPFWRNFAFWLIVATFLVFSLALSRLALMFFIFFAIAFYHQTIRRISLPKIFLVFLSCFMLVLVTGYFKGKQIEKESSISTKKIAKLVLTVPYQYLANNFWNLDFALNPPNYRERHPTTYGFGILEGFTDIPVVPLGSAMRKSTRIDDQFNKSAAKVKGLNTVLYQWTLYKDFGVYGVFFGSFLIGLFMGVLYQRVRRCPTVLNTMAYSFLIFFVADSVFTFMTESPMYTYGFLFMSGTCYLCETVLSGGIRRREGLLVGTT